MPRQVVAADGGTLILEVAEADDFAMVGVRNPAKASQDLASICDERVPPVRPLIEPHGTSPASTQARA